MEITEALINRRTRLFSKVFAYVSLGLVVAFLAYGILPIPRSLWELGYIFFYPPVIPAILIYLLFCLWIGALIAKMAWKKGRSWNAFFVLSLFFPLIAWIIAAVISTDQATATSGNKKCPKCAEMIKAEATLCKHCGSEV